MSRSRNGRGRRHNYYRYHDRKATEREKRLRIAEQIMKEEIFSGEELKLQSKSSPKVVIKIGDKWMVQDGGA